MSFLKTIKLKKSALLLILSVGIFALISFVEKKQSDKLLSNVIVNINSEYDNYFIDEAEVLRLITADDKELILNKHYETVNLRTLEMRLKTHHFVEDAQVFKDHKGNLVINIEQCRPLARILQVNGPSAYVSDQGIALTTSDKFTARVLIIDGVFAKKMIMPGFFATQEGQPYFELLNYIDSEEFWKAQVAQITIDQYGELTITPQVGKEQIDFGTPEGYEEKFRKLMIFYKKILPNKGWNTYDVVRLKYKDQIICEKATI